jgi:hypothetical protein
VLYANDRGCTAPGCTVPGYYSEVHHVTAYATCRCTDVNNLTCGCGEWIPPPHLDRGQPRTNTFWHPENLLRGEDDDEW